jgi:hypothetical protein
VSTRSIRANAADIGKQLKQLIEACSAMIDARFNAIAEKSRAAQPVDTDARRTRRGKLTIRAEALADLGKLAKTDQALWQELAA